MTERLLEVPVDRRKLLASALETGVLLAPHTTGSLHAALGSHASDEAAAEALSELDRLGVSGPAAGAWIRTLDRATARRALPDLVWSGPRAAGVHARETRRVFEELIGGAQRTLWASSYAFFDGPEAFRPFATRMEQVPGLRVNLLLNIQRRRGDTTAPDQLVLRFADRFWSADWPGASRPSVFYDPRSLEPGGPTGVLHAKALVADEEHTLVTSANLTEAALDRNIELGLLVRDRALALGILTHFQTLIEQGALLPLPLSGGG